MKVLIPEFILDRTEDEYMRLLVAYMYRLAFKYGFRQEYVMWSHDVKVISQQFFADNETVIKRYGFLYPEIRCGLLSSTSFVFRWRHEPIAKLVELTNPKSILIWEYLMEVENQSNGDLLEKPEKSNIARKEFRVLPARQFRKYNYISDPDGKAARARVMNEARIKRAYNKKSKDLGLDK